MGWNGGSIHIPKKKEKMKWGREWLVGYGKKEYIQEVEKLL
jgi:hypothetical protein